MPAPHEITPKHLLRLIDTADCPPIVDISIDPDCAEDPYLIPGSFRHPHSDFDGLLGLLAGRACVIICQKGIKLSQGLTSRLRGRGVDAQYLSGGMYGWRDTDGAPRIPFSALPNTGLWVTRHRPKIDRIACPWLIRRFVNPAAEFMFVAPEWVLGAADRYGATAFDVPDAPLGHIGGRCTFDAMLDFFELRTAPLLRLADVIRAADTGQNDACPQAAGLLAVSVGLSRMHKDDHTQLEAAMPLYDALYRWARDGQSETHSSFGDPS